MDITTQSLNIVKERIDAIVNDEQLCFEILNQLKSTRRPRQLESLGLIDTESVVRFMENPHDTDNQPSLRELESIIVRSGRPAFLIRNNTTILDSTPVQVLETWRSRINSAKENLDRAIASIGRIEIENHLTLDWLGTGWLVKDDVIVTNRHVAEVFAKCEGDQIKFRKNFLGRSMKGFVDFREEHFIDAELEFRIDEVLHIEPDNGPDIAFCRVDRSVAHVDRVQPLVLSRTPPVQHQRVAVIGYPASDSRILDPLVMRQVFGDVFNVKRLAPGEISSVSPGALEHDCSTLGGNAGSPVIDFETGDVVGLHFAGSYLRANFAVDAATIMNRLENL